jgi:hypothetical protein
MQLKLPSSAMLRRMALVRTDVPQELSASIIRVTRIGEIGSVSRLLVTANVVPSSPILITLMMGRHVPLKRRHLQEPHGVTSQKTAFFIVTDVKTSNLTRMQLKSTLNNLRTCMSTNSYKMLRCSCKLYCRVLCCTVNV